MTDPNQPEDGLPSPKPSDGPPVEAPAQTSSESGTERDFAPPHEPHFELESVVEPPVEADVADDEPGPAPVAARVVVPPAAPAATVIPMLAGRRQFARTTPVVVDRGRATFGFPSLGDRRQLGQIGLIVLMVAALGAILLARSGAPGPSGLANGGSPTPHGSAAASPKASPRPSAVPTQSPGGSSSPGAGSPTPSPTARPHTYTVKSGDTLSGIAAKFHTTAKIIEQLNKLKSPFVIHPGEVLKLP
jgi:LysM repeat protein